MIQKTLHLIFLIFENYNYYILYLYKNQLIK